MEGQGDHLHRPIGGKVVEQGLQQGLPVEQPGLTEAPWGDRHGVTSRRRRQPPRHCGQGRPGGGLQPQGRLSLEAAALRQSQQRGDRIEQATNR